MVVEQDAKKWNAGFAFYYVTISSQHSLKSNAFCTLHFHMARFLCHVHCTTIRGVDCFCMHAKVMFAFQGDTNSASYLTSLCLHKTYKAFFSYWLIQVLTLDNLFSHDLIFACLFTLISES